MSQLRFLVCVALLAGLSCGDEDKAKPGYGDPCETAMGPVLGCPPSSASLFGDSTIEEACNKLVSCGILAAFRELENSSGEKYHRLDFEWCVSRLAKPIGDDCDDDRPFTEAEVASAIECIRTTPCPALGLRLTDKELSSTDDSNPRPELDRYTCEDSTTTTWTATVCDKGILRY